MTTETNEGIYDLDITYEEHQRFNAIEALGLLIQSSLSNRDREDQVWISGERIKEYILRLEKKIKILEEKAT